MSRAWNPSSIVDKDKIETNKEVDEMGQLVCHYKCFIERENERKK